MKRHFVLPVLLLLCVTVACAPGSVEAENGESDRVPESQTEKISYAIGVNVGMNMKNQPIELDNDLLVQGILDALEGSELQMSTEEMQATIQTLQEVMQEKQQAQGAESKKAGEEFLAQNKEREDVVTLESGLQYEVLEEGDGPSPTKSDTVKVHYHGTLVDGTVFDSSVERGEPVTFPVGGVIPGWTEALQLMNVGSKWKLFIPSDLAYGPRAAGSIPPNSTLLFEVELLGIEEQE